MNLDSDRTDRFGQTLLDALLTGFDHAWTRTDFDTEPQAADDVPAAPGHEAAAGRDCDR